MHPLDAILRPRSIAVVGASRQAGTIGHQIVSNLLQHGFTGPVYPVNPCAVSVRSIRAFASVPLIPDPVDLAVIAVPPDFACHRRVCVLQRRQTDGKLAALRANRAGLAGHGVGSLRHDGHRLRAMTQLVLVANATHTLRS